MSDIETIETQVPARIDRLPWSRWHTLMVMALGVTWILDGLEVTIVGNISAVLTSQKSGLGLSESQVGIAGSVYIAGACSGALLFSYLSDRYGRKKLFLITLAIYLVFTVATAFSFNFLSFALFRFFTGAGIGGEYAAVYSAIDELVPAWVRGTASLVISGSYWAGAAIASVLSVALLSGIVPQFYGWRFTFALGALFGLVILLVRRFVPESPRWLMTHGRFEEAERIADEIEDDVRRYTGREELPSTEGKSITVEQRGSIGFGLIARAMFRMYPKRTLLGLALMASQAFLYNAIFFTYALVLQKFYKVRAGGVGYYLRALAVGSLLGPVLLGRLFDRAGRRPMIIGCYATTGVLLTATGMLFAAGLLGATTQTLVWTVMFFFASASGSAGYLTVSEIFPMEIRAMAIALFYAIATALGGVSGPAIYGTLIETGSRELVFIGYLVAAILMIGAALVEWAIGVEAEQKSLEDIAVPLTAIKEESGSDCVVEER